MERILVLGRGGAGKSALARRLGVLAGLPVVELDQCFWQQDLAATPPERWVELQRELTRGRRWILDGDLGPYDAPEARLRAADTIVILDFSLARCAWRSIRRSREGADYWRWVIGYRRRSLPGLLAAIERHAGGASVHILRSPRATGAFLSAKAPTLDRVRVSAAIVPQMDPTLIEFPADDPERARRFWSGLLGTELDERVEAEGEGWQTHTEATAVGVHPRGSGPGDTVSLPYFTVANVDAALEQVKALGGSVIHPGSHWAICRDSEGSPFGLALRRGADAAPS